MLIQHKGGSIKEVLVTFTAQQVYGICPEEGIVQVPGLETKPRERKKGRKCENSLEMNLLKRTSIS